MERGSLEFYRALFLLFALLLGFLYAAEDRRGKILDARLPLQRSVHTGTWKRINTIQGDSGRVQSLRSLNASLAESLLQVRIAFESLWNCS